MPAFFNFAPRIRDFSIRELVVVPTLAMHAFKAGIVARFRPCQTDECSFDAIREETPSVDLNQENLARDDYGRRLCHRARLVPVLGTH